MYNRFRKRAATHDAKHVNGSTRTYLTLKDHKEKDARVSAFVQALGFGGQRSRAYSDQPWHAINGELSARLGNMRLTPDSHLAIEPSTNALCDIKCNVSQRGNGHGYDGYSGASQMRNFCEPEGSQGHQYQGGSSGGQPPSNRRGNPGGFHGVPNSRPQPPPPVHAERAYACPFWKFHMRAHMRCATFSSPRIGDVIQHITRTHLVEYYCQDCHETFARSRDYDDHFRPQRCQPNDLLCPALTKRELQYMKSLSSRELPPKEKWINMWDFLFPNVPARDPYHSEDWLEEWSCGLIDHFFEDGPSEDAFFDLVSNAVPPHLNNPTLLLQDRMRRLFKEDFRNPPIPQPAARRYVPATFRSV